MFEISVEKEVKTFLKNLVWLKNYHNLSNEKMAEILEISIEMWDEVEIEKIPTSLTVDVFYRIKEYFDVNPTDMIYKSFTE